MCPALLSQQRVTVRDEAKPVNEDTPALTRPPAAGTQGGAGLPGYPSARCLRPGQVELDPAGPPFPILSNEKDRLGLACLAGGDALRSGQGQDPGSGQVPG